MLPSYFASSGIALGVGGILPPQQTLGIAIFLSNGISKDLNSLSGSKLSFFNIHCYVAISIGNMGF